MVFNDWYPVTHDFGLINAPLSTVVDDLRKWHAGIGVSYERREIFLSLEASFRELPPLSASKRRRLFVNTRAEWTACFQSGIDGSDPFPAMSVLAQRLGVLAMRICSTPPNALWPGVVWEVYAPEKLGGEPPLFYRRSVCAMNDGGRWVFHQSGVPFEFEEVEAYCATRKRDRFRPEMLDRYLRHFALKPFVDDFYVVDRSKPAVLLERPPWRKEPPEFTLAQVVAGEPWKRA